jgi:hypothetical protein
MWATGPKSSWNVPGHDCSSLLLQQKFAEYKKCQTSTKNKPTVTSVPQLNLPHTLEPGYNDIGLWDTSSITSDVLCYQLIPPC